MAPYVEIQHIFNGHIVDPGSEDCQHLDDCDWNPFMALETPEFFHTYISSTPDEYVVHVKLPSFISRYIRVQKNNRTLAIVGKAMAKRQWTDDENGSRQKPKVNIHEQWKVYWRLFKIPLQCDLGDIRAWYGLNDMRVTIPRRNTWAYRFLNRIEDRAGRFLGI